MANLLTQNRFSATSRIRATRSLYFPCSIRSPISVPDGALVSKSRRMTWSNCSSVSITEKSRSGRKLDGKTNRSCRLMTNGCMRRLLCRGKTQLNKHSTAHHCVDNTDRAHGGYTCRPRWVVLAPAILPHRSVRRSSTPVSRWSLSSCRRTTGRSGGIDRSPMGGLSRTAAESGRPDRRASAAGRRRLGCTSRSVPT